MLYGMEIYLDINRNIYKKLYINIDICLMYVVWKIYRYNLDFRFYLFNYLERKLVVIVKDKYGLVII